MANITLKHPTLKQLVNNGFRINYRVTRGLQPLLAGTAPQLAALPPPHTHSMGLRPFQAVISPHSFSVHIKHILPCSLFLCEIKGKVRYGNIHLNYSLNT